MAARSAGTVALALGLLLAAGAAGRSSGPTLTVQPTVTGAAEVGSRLAAGSGTWTSATAISYAYQWYRCDGSGGHCSSIHGATAPGLMLAARDAGKTIGLTVTANDAAGSTPAYASLVGPIARARPLLVSTVQPQVAGLPVEGKTLQVTTGAWSPVPTALAYSWRRCNANGRLCVPIPGADASAYTVTASDVGHALVALVEGTFGATLQPALSTATPAAIGGDIAGPSHTTPPVVRGSAVQGAQLSATAGVWTGIGSLGYGYQWYRCDDAGAHCSAIRGATGTTYRTVAADTGKTLGFTVRATDTTGTATAYSSLVGPVAAAHAAVVSTGPAALTGSPRPGSTLTADAGGWRPRPHALSYAWRRCNANGRICVPIAGATSPSYAVTTADVGHALVAVVTALLGPATQAAYSAASPPVT